MNLVHLSKQEYNTLSTTGTLTKGGVTYTFDPLNNEYITPGGLYKHDCNVTVGPDSGYFTGQVTIINDSPETITINNNTMKQAISAFGVIKDGPDDYILEEGIIGVVVRKRYNANVYDVFLVARPDTDIYYEFHDFDDHTNYSVTDYVTKIL